MSPLTTATSPATTSVARAQVRCKVQPCPSPAYSSVTIGKTPPSSNGAEGRKTLIPAPCPDCVQKSVTKEIFAASQPLGSPTRGSDLCPAVRGSGVVPVARLDHHILSFPPGGVGRHIMGYLHPRELAVGLGAVNSSAWGSRALVTNLCVRCGHWGAPGRHSPRSCSSRVSRVVPLGPAAAANGSNRDPGVRERRVVLKLQEVGGETQFEIRNRLGLVLGSRDERLAQEGTHGAGGAVAGRHHPCGGPLPRSPPCNPGHAGPGSCATSACAMGVASPGSVCCSGNTPGGFLCKSNVASSTPPPASGRSAGVGVGAGGDKPIGWWVRPPLPIPGVLSLVCRSRLSLRVLVLSETPGLTDEDLIPLFLTS
ncbi:unnamed protein product, partial [Discosporangium mesarthrocarpum]